MDSGTVQPANTENVRKGLELWKQLNLESPSNIAIFYAGGHGTARADKNAIVLLEDFAKYSTVLTNSVEVGGSTILWWGLNRSEASVLFCGCL